MKPSFLHSLNVPTRSITYVPQPVFVTRFWKTDQNVMHEIQGK